MNRYYAHGGNVYDRRNADDQRPVLSNLTTAEAEEMARYRNRVAVRQSAYDRMAARRRGVKP